MLINVKNILRTQNISYSKCGDSCWKIYLVLIDRMKKCGQIVLTLCIELLKLLCIDKESPFFFVVETTEDGYMIDFSDLGSRGLLLLCKGFTSHQQLKTYGDGTSV